MAQQTINVGASPNDGTGTPLRTAFQYTNSNFSELYTATGPSGNNIVVPGSATITGDLTVRTNKLFVNSVGVGIGAAATSYQCEINSGASASTSQFKSTGASVISRFADGTGETGYIGSGISLMSGISRTDFGIASNGALVFGVSTGLAMTLNSTGLGISVVPSAWDSANYKALQVSRTSVASLSNIGIFASNWFADTGGDKYIANGFAARIDVNNGGTIQFKIAPNNTSGASQPLTFTQAMTLDASGNLLVGKTTTAATALGGVAYIGRVDCSRDTGNAATFNHTTAGNLVGNIAITSTATTYNSASDYRLKESVQPLSGGLARVSALKPSIYKWKVDGSSGEGFLAHELADVVPLAVTGEKDAVDADGKPTYQGVDLSKVVPILVAAIQELTARVQTLEAK